MKIAGKQVILTDDRDSDPEDYFRWFNLEEWQYYDRPDHAFQPVSREQFNERAQKNQERYEERAQDKSKPKPGFHIDTVIPAPVRVLVGYCEVHCFFCQFQVFLHPGNCVKCSQQFRAQHTGIVAAVHCFGTVTKTNTTFIFSDAQIIQYKIRDSF